MYELRGQIRRKHAGSKGLGGASTKVVIDSRAPLGAAAAHMHLQRGGNASRLHGLRNLSGPSVGCILGASWREHEEESSRPRPRNNRTSRNGDGTPKNVFPRCARRKLN